MDVGMLCRMLDYNYWAHDKVWTFVMKLSDEQFTRPCDYSVGSVHAQVVHTMAAENLLFRRMHGESPSSMLVPEDYPTREAVRARWDALEADIRAYIGGLSEAQLREEVHYVSISGKAQRVNFRWEIAMQLINHGTDHRAQTLGLIHQLGGETDAQDFIFFSWEN